MTALALFVPDRQVWGCPLIGPTAPCADQGPPKRTVRRHPPVWEGL